MENKKPRPQPRPRPHHHVVEKINKYNPLEFLFCILQATGCKYSIKKVLSLVFVGLVIYLAFTDGNVQVINAFLFMIGALLAIRSYDKGIRNRHDRYYGDPIGNEPIEPGEEEPEI